MDGTTGFEALGVVEKEGYRATPIASDRKETLGERMLWVEGYMGGSGIL